jgi:hypothetical protein
LLALRERSGRRHSNSGSGIALATIVLAVVTPLAEPPYVERLPVVVVMPM